MKITIFIIVLVLKSNKTWKFDISDCYSLLTAQNPAKTVYLKTCSKCLPPAFTQAWSLLIKLTTAWLTEFCDRSSHILCKTFTDFRQWYVAWVKCLVAFKHGSPDMVIKRIKVWWVRHNYLGVTKKIPRWKIVIFIVIALRGSVVV